MTITEIEKKLQEYRLRKERQRIAIQLASKPLWERILPDSVISILKSQFAAEKTKELDTRSQELEDQNINGNLPRQENTVFKRRQTKQTPIEAEEYINQSDSEDDVAPSASNDNIQWLIFGLKVALSITLYLLCLKLEIGALFVIVFAFYIILSNLSNRRKKHSEPSAYSVFNPNCEAIDGTINPEQFEKEIRYGF